MLIGKTIKMKNIYVIKEDINPYQVRLNTPEAIAVYLHDAFKNLDSSREHMFSISLNTKNRLIAANIISLGSLNANIVHPREVFYSAIADRAAAIVVAHNHPSGDTAPSQCDIDITRKLQKSGEIIGISLLDHIILGESGLYLSMKEQNLF